MLMGLKQHRERLDPAARTIRRPGLDAVCTCCVCGSVLGSVPPTMRPAARHLPSPPEAPVCALAHSRLRGSGEGRVWLLCPGWGLAPPCPSWTLSREPWPPAATGIWISPGPIPVLAQPAAKARSLSVSLRVPGPRHRCRLHPLPRSILGSPLPQGTVRMPEASRPAHIHPCQERSPHEKENGSSRPNPGFRPRHVVVLGQTILWGAVLGVTRCLAASGLSPPGASSIPRVTPKNVCRHFQMPPGVTPVTEAIPSGELSAARSPQNEEGSGLWAPRSGDFLDYL